MEYEYGYDDPVLGEVSCSDEEQARSMATATGGEAWIKTWKDGEEFAKEPVL